MEDGFFEPNAPLRIAERNLPHWAQENAWYFLTYRLADAIPAEKLKSWNEERRLWCLQNPEPHTPEQQTEYHQRFTTRFHHWLDAGHGECILAKSECSEIVANSIRFFDGKRYELSEWVVMPNHVHVLLRLKDGAKVPDILHSWKSDAAKQICQRLHRKGQIWQHESFDHIVRSEASLRKFAEYIRANPAKARIKVQHASWQK